MLSSNFTANTGEQEKMSRDNPQVVEITEALDDLPCQMDVIKDFVFFSVCWSRVSQLPPHNRNRITKQSLLEQKGALGISGSEYELPDNLAAHQWTLLKKTHLFWLRLSLN